MHQLAWAWWAQCRRDEAIEMTTKCIELRKETLKPDDPDLLASMSLLKTIEAGDMEADLDDTPSISDKTESNDNPIRAPERR
ncbi:uncharacterized protein A1O9_07594 [Exophiala aquamarina CBS 119918]|uniref:Uncharacterized protein n=1 Tax=Exophiala aquamarina CBS 119918 TaxID=1182545 RepID=A0A072P7B6_9EURO|nr:uncharacterized protein A1O9_07594 [Exophiala aquamarina CBS 119918]KEF56014.1 hypothetical protein A1O9_07594 [Exophiala aquamarina CBS 119918]